MLKAKWEIGLNGSVLIANPLPAQFEVPAEKMETFIQQALKEAAETGISGKEVTPFLLKRIAENTGGESLEANIALIKNNAALAARIAKALCAL
jgi:pseudouridine-5'-phosphate glycosidase